MAVSAAMKIGDLCERTGLTTQTIHFYEKSGLLHPAHRKGSGYRYYDNSSLDRLELISRLKSLGLSLDEIRQVIPAYEMDESGAAGKEHVLELLRGHLIRTDKQLANLARFRDELLGNIVKMEVFLAQARGMKVDVTTALPDQRK